MLGGWRIGGLYVLLRVLPQPAAFAALADQLGIEGSGIVYGLSGLVVAIITGALWLSTLEQPLAFEALNQTALRYTFIAIAALTVPAHGATDVGQSPKPGNERGCFLKGYAST